MKSLPKTKVVHSRGIRDVELLEPVVLKSQEFAAFLI